MLTRGQILILTILIAAIGSACTLIIGGIRDPWVILSTAGLNATISASALLKTLPKVEWTVDEREQYRKLLEQQEKAIADTKK